jgi:DNA-binding transcriptional LysR family regulator
MSIKLQQLQHFELVATHKGFRNASKSALRTQAALSSSIKSLEKELGTSLFETGHKAILTPYGRACLPKVRAMLKHYNSLENFMHTTAQGSSGHIRIGCIPSVVQKVLPTVLPRFTTAYPDIKVSLMDDTSERVYHRLLDGRIDVALSSRPKTLAQGISFVPIFTDPLGVVCHKDHPLAHSVSVELHQLLEYPFISNGVSLFMESSQAKMLNDNATHYVENVLSLSTALQLNIGVTILGKMAMPQNQDCLVWIPLDADEVQRSIGLMYSDDSDGLAPTMKNFLSICTESLQNL